MLCVGGSSCDLYGNLGELCMEALTPLYVQGVLRRASLCRGRDASVDTLECAEEERSSDHV